MRRARVKRREKLITRKEKEFYKESYIEEKRSDMGKRSILRGEFRNKNEEEKLE